MSLSSVDQPMEGIVQKTVAFSMRRKKTWLFALIVTVLIFLYLAQRKVEPTYFETLIARNVEDFGSVDPNVTCKFPFLHPFAPDTHNHVRVAPPLRCPTYNRFLFYIDDDGYLDYNVTAWAELGLNPGAPYLKCQYSELVRLRQRDNITEYTFPKFKHFTVKTKPISDFLFVECRNLLGIPVYSDYFAHAQKRVDTRKYEDNELDVVIIGLDSMSRLNFIRQLPKTYEYMHNELGAIDLIGFNKVGLNTFPNVMVMLRGEPPTLPPYDFEKMAYLWDYYKKKGAVTMYAEDKPDMNMFVLRGGGKIKQPTDHYAFPFWQAVEKSFLSTMSGFGCLGSRTKHSIHFNYIKSFLRNYKESPKFLFSLHNEITHDYLNIAGVLDNELKYLLESSFEEGLLKNSIVIVLGDHGQRLDSFRLTEMGKIEDFMPYVSFILPKGSKNPIVKKWRKNLARNSNRLTSAYDLHKTFLDILSTLDYKKESDVSELKKHGLGLSLFTDIPKNRTCYTAGIPEWYCSCTNVYENATALKITDQKAVDSAKLVIDDLNKKFISKTKLCSELSLFSVTRAFYFELSQNKYRIHIMFITKPSDGHFETILEVFPNKTYNIIGDVIRLNSYAGQSECLPKNLMIDEFFKSSCYCKDKR